MGTFPLCIFRENLTGPLYCKILEWHFYLKLNGNRWFLVADNNPKHTSKVVKRFMEENMPQKLLDWPSQSQILIP